MDMGKKQTWDNLRKSRKNIKILKPFFITSRFIRNHILLRSEKNSYSYFMHSNKYFKFSESWSNALTFSKNIF